MMSLSPGAVTDGVTLFFLKKVTTFLVIVSIPTLSAFQAIVSPVFFVNSAAKKTFISVSPPWMDGPGAVRPSPLPVTQLSATANYNNNAVLCENSTCAHKLRRIQHKNKTVNRLLNQQKYKRRRTSKMPDNSSIIHEGGTNTYLAINPYPGNWGVKYPPVHFFLCISETLKDTAMRFGDIVQDSQGYLTLYKVLSHLYRKCQHGGLETGSTF